jgi:hypothetical protein
MCSCRLVFSSRFSFLFLLFPSRSLSFFKVLLPLHKAKSLSVYHPQLAYVNHLLPPLVNSDVGVNSLSDHVSYRVSDHVHPHALVT